MSRLPKLLFFIKVLIGMCIPMILAALIYGPWWIEDGIIIPILFLADAIFSFYFVYKTAFLLHFPKWGNSVLPAVYGFLVPLVIASLLYIVTAMPNVKITDSPFYDQMIVLFSVASFIAAMLTFTFIWGGIKIWNRFKWKRRGQIPS